MMVDGQRVNLEQCPGDYDMESGDQIDAMAEQQGGLGQDPAAAAVAAALRDNLARQAQIEAALERRRSVMAATLRERGRSNGSSSRAAPPRRRRRPRRRRHMVAARGEPGEAAAMAIDASSVAMPPARPLFSGSSDCWKNDPSRDAASNLSPPALAFAKAASLSSLWRLRRSSSNFFGKSPIGPDGW